MATLFDINKYFQIKFEYARLPSVFQTITTTGITIVERSCMKQKYMVIVYVHPVFLTLNAGQTNPTLQNGLYFLCSG